MFKARLKPTAPEVEVGFNFKVYIYFFLFYKCGEIDWTKQKIINKFKKYST